MSRIINNHRYLWTGNPNHKEIHSADGKTFIKGGHGNWEVYVKEVHLASFFRRQWAREFIREKKKQ